MSALFGYQPELDLSGNDTLYGAIRYDEAQRPLRDIIRKTYFDGLDLVPGNLELQEFEHTTPRVLAERRGPAADMFFTRVQAALQSVADDYDVVVLDCPPQLGFLTLSALCAAIAGFLRAQFGDRVLTAPMVKSTAVSDAGLTKQTLYEVGRENFSRVTYDRAMESLTAVNGEIEALIHSAWNRPAKGGKA